MAETGLLRKWKRQYGPNAGPCYDAKNNIVNELEKSKTKKEGKPLIRMTLKHLSGAFVLLLSGIVFSFTVFIGEIIMFNYFNCESFQYSMGQKIGDICIHLFSKLSCDRLMNLRIRNCQFFFNLMNAAIDNFRKLLKRFPTFFERQIKLKKLDGNLVTRFLAHCYSNIKNKTFPSKESRIQQQENSVFIVPFVNFYRTVIRRPLLLFGRRRIQVKPVTHGDYIERFESTAA